MHSPEKRHPAGVLLIRAIGDRTGRTLAGNRAALAAPNALPNKIRVVRRDNRAGDSAPCPRKRRNGPPDPDASVTPATPPVSIRPL